MHFVFKEKHFVIEEKHFVLRKYHLFWSESRPGQHLTEGVHWAVDHLPSAAKLLIDLLFSKRFLIIFKKRGSFVVKKGEFLLFSKRVFFLNLNGRFIFFAIFSSLHRELIVAWSSVMELYLRGNNAINITNHFLLHAPFLPKTPSAYNSVSKQSDCVDQIRYGGSKALKMSSVRV